MIFKIASNSKARILLTFGLLDAFFVWCLFLVPVLVVAVLSGQHLQSDLPRFLQLYWPVCLFLAFPISVLTAWRGALDALRIQRGKSLPARAAAEGFTLGMGYAVVFFTFGYVQQVLAAGTIYDEVTAQPTNPLAWAKLVASMLPYGFLCGIAGSCLGLLIHELNRLLIGGVDGIFHRKIETTL